MSSEGLAQQINPAIIILNLTTSLALTRITPIIVDFIMLNIMGNRR
jgi:hypothetical protein